MFRACYLCDIPVCSLEFPYGIFLMHFIINQAKIISLIALTNNSIISFIKKNKIKIKKGFGIA